MTGVELAVFRKAIGISQAEMAEKLGYGSRGYQKMEILEKLNKRQTMVVERFSLQIAVERRNLALILPAIESDALRFVYLLKGA